MPRSTTIKTKSGPEVIDVLAPPGTAVSTPDPDESSGPDPEPIVDPPVPAPRAVRPVPEDQLTPEQKRIRHLEDQLARERGKKDPEPELAVLARPGDDANIVIHFLEDGFTALGQVWYRGQELEFEPGSGAYQDTFDRFGRTWLDLRHNEFAQVDRYGKVMFRSGPWPGKSLVEAKAMFESLKAVAGDGRVAAPTESELADAAAKESARRRAAPRLSVR